MSTKKITETFICLGDIIGTPIDFVINNGSGTIVTVLVDVPSGVKYSSSNLTHGEFNPSTNEWKIGFLRNGEAASGILYWEVTNDCLEPYKFNFTVASDGENVCVNSTTNLACVLITGLTYCKVHNYKPIKKIYTDYTIQLPDYRLEVYAEDDEIEITLPNPAEFYDLNKEAGSEWFIKIMNLDNPVTLVSDYKIVATSTLEDAGTTFPFSIAGQNVAIQATEEYYLLTSI